jgi:hypothetical protein
MSKDRKCIVTGQCIVAKRYRFNSKSFQIFFYISDFLVITRTGPDIEFHCLKKIKTMKNTSENKTTNEPENIRFMYSVRNFRITVTFLSLIVCADLTAQPGIRFYADAGKNNVSDGLFITSSAFGSYEFGKNRVEAGIQLDLKSNDHPLFSGYTVNASREQLIKGSLLSLQGFCTWTNYSEILRETNCGALFSMRHKRFELAVGTNFRTYAFNAGAVKEYDIDKAAVRFHENFNLMYSLSYYVKPTDDNWNAGLSVTNFDSFVINQGVNPALRLRGLYKPGSQVCLYAEAWYFTAGLLNMSMNHFGLLFKTGLSWNF